MPGSPLALDARHSRGFESHHPDRGLLLTNDPRANPSGHVGNERLHALTAQFLTTSCRIAWLFHLSGGQEIGGSNPSN